MIIRKIGFLVCMLVVCSLNINTAMAQSRSYEGGITVNPVRLEQKGDFIHVDIDFVLNNVKVKSARGMDFIPRLVTPGMLLRKEHWQRINVCLKDVPWRSGIIWHADTIFRETNTTLSLEVKTGTDWRRRLKQSNWNIKTKCWILSGTYLLKKEEKQN